MTNLSKKEIEEEIAAIKEVLKIHKSTVEQNKQGVKINEFLLEVMQKELERFK
jgi:hypothetical protein